MSGTVDVRTRDNVRHGKMRIDALGEHLMTLKPMPSVVDEQFYKNAWNPKDYPSANQELAEAKVPHIPKEELAHEMATPFD